MHKTATRFVVQSLAAAVFGVGLLTGVLMWQLAQGPIRLNFITPYVEAALNPASHPFNVRLSHTILTWAGWKRALDVRAVDVQVMGAEGQLLADIPQLSLGLSARALFRGIVAPTSLDIIGARLRIVRAADGSFDLGLGVAGDDGIQAGDTTVLARGLLEQLMLAPDPSKTMGYLSRVSALNAELLVDDRGRNIFWTAPDANITFVRDSDGIRGRARLNVVADGRRGEFDVSGIYSAADRTLDVTLDFEGVAPALLATIEPTLAEVRRVDVPVSGTVAVSLGADFQPETVTFDFDGAAGSLSLPEYYAEPIRVDALELAGRLSDGGDRLAIDKANIDLGGPTLDIKAAATRTDGAYVIELDADVSDVPADAVGTWWPENLAKGARNWVLRNMHEGTFDRATLHISGSAPTDDLAAIAITDLSGEMQAGGMDVHYLRPMTPVRDARAHAVFDRSHFLVTVESGTLNDLRLEGGTIDLVNLDRRPQWANINLTIVGPVLDALRLIDEPPLRYATKLGFNMDGVEGRQRTNLVMRVPLTKKVKLDDVDVAAAASITDFAAERAAFGNPVRDGRLTLLVDRNRMSVNGSLVTAGANMQADWHYNFAQDAEFRSRYQIVGLLDNEARLQTAFSSVPFIEGALGVDLTYTEYINGLAAGSARLDLTDATIDLQGAQWRKESGVDGRGYAEFIIENGQLSRIPVFEIDAGGLITQGTAEFAPIDEDVALKRVAFQRLNFGDNDVYGTVDVAEDRAYDVLLAGTSLDLRVLFDKQDDEDEGGERAFPPFSLTITPVAPLARVRLGDETNLTNVTGTLRHDGQDWRTASIDGLLSEGGALSIHLTESDGGRDLRFVAEDAGALLRATDFHRQIESGRLEVVGAYDDEAPGKPFVGFARMTDFRLHEAPVLAQILTLSSLTGIVDTLSGDGIAFSRLEVPFRLTEDRLEITGAKARGSAVGLTGDGIIDWATDEVTFAGDVVPAYGINGNLSKIPLIGPLIAGGQDGIFAAAYKVSGPTSRPEVTVNPLTVLTPGIIRGFFKLFDQTPPPEFEPPNGAGPGPAPAEPEIAP